MSRQPASAHDLALHLSAELQGSDQPLLGVRTLADPAAGALGFANSPQLVLEVERALRVGAVLLVPHDMVIPDVGEGSIIAVENPRAAFASAIRQFFTVRPVPGIAASAIVHESAEVHETASVGEYTVIGPDVVVGARTEIRNSVVVSTGVRIGTDCLVKSHAVIGEEGFGIDRDSEGNNVRLPHIGSVVIDDHVEIGSFTTVCSGTIAPTRIAHHTKIDDHVHVAHNVQVGANCTITACAEISGSVHIGDNVWIGPNASIREGLEIGEGSLLGIGAVVTKSVAPKQVHFGNPARRIRDNT